RCTMIAGNVMPEMTNMVEVSTRSPGTMPSWATRNNPNIATSKEGTRARVALDTTSPNAINARTIAVARIALISDAPCSHSYQQCLPRSRVVGMLAVLEQWIDPLRLCHQRVRAVNDYVQRFLDQCDRDWR